MSDPSLDTLAETARNRGLKLVRSRVRTPGKNGFGKAGLTDLAGTKVFGIDEKGPAATPAEIEDYLRNLEALDWGASLDGPERPRGERKSAPLGSSTARRAACRPSALHNPNRSTAQRAPRPTPPSKPEIRDARDDDFRRLAELIAELGHDMDAKQVRKNLAALIKADEAPLVATLDGKVVGLCGVGKRLVISRPVPLGRITSLIVTRDVRGRGIGRMLVAAAEAWMRQHGCGLVELTSNDKRAEAHAFYRHLGYERTSIRFAKKL